MTMKKPKFKGKMAHVKSLQELLIKAKEGEVLNLRWQITNISKSKPWPIEPYIMNFSEDNIFDNQEESGQEINSAFQNPILLETLLQPGAAYIYEVQFTVPRNLGRSGATKTHCSLSFYLTNPAKNFEKFGDPMLAFIEIEAVNPPVSPYVKSEYLSEEEEGQQDEEQKS